VVLHLLAILVQEVALREATTVLANPAKRGSLPASIGMDILLEVLLSRIDPFLIIHHPLRPGPLGRATAECPAEIQGGPVRLLIKVTTLSGRLSLSIPALNRRSRHSLFVDPRQRHLFLPRCQRPGQDYLQKPGVCRTLMRVKSRHSHGRLLLARV